MDRPLDFNQQMAETSDRSDHEEGRATGATERTATRSDPKSKRKTDVAPSSDEDSTLIDDRTALSTSRTHFFRFVSFRFPLVGRFPVRVVPFDGLVLPLSSPLHSKAMAAIDACRWTIELEPKWKSSAIKNCEFARRGGQTTFDSNGRISPKKFLFIRPRRDLSALLFSTRCDGDRFARCDASRRRWMSLVAFLPRPSLSPSLLAGGRTIGSESAERRFVPLLSAEAAQVDLRRSQRFVSHERKEMFADEQCATSFQSQSLCQGKRRVASPFDCEFCPEEKPSLRRPSDVNEELGRGDERRVDQQ